MTSEDAPTGAATEPCGNLRDLPIVLWEVDSRGYIVRMDGNETLLTGTSFAALRGANVLEVFAHAIPDLRTNFDLAMEGRNPHMTATVFGRTWALHSSPRGEGAERRLIGVAYDMTDTLRTEAALETALAHLRRFESIVEEGPAIVFAWRVEAGAPVEYISQNVAQTGYTAHEFLLGSVTWNDIVEPADVFRVERKSEPIWPATRMPSAAVTAFDAGMAKNAGSRNTAGSCATALDAPRASRALRST
jgi:PAS domain-containing protein